MVTLRPMSVEDLPAVAAWLLEPHVARWWLPDTTAEAVIEKYRERLTGAAEATTMLTVLEQGHPIGWCQWYRWSSYPDEARALDAYPGEAGIDYAIGDPAATGRGVGTDLIAELTRKVRARDGDVGLLVAADAMNLKSRRALEKNGFHLVSVRSVSPRRGDERMAIYRLSAQRPLSELSKKE